MDDTEKRLENSIRNRPDNWIVVRDKQDKLLEAHDRDAGRRWFKTDKGWFFDE